MVKVGEQNANLGRRAGRPLQFTQKAKKAPRGVGALGEHQDKKPSKQSWKVVTDVCAWRGGIVFS